MSEMGQSVVLTVRRSLPIFPNKRIISAFVGMSQRGQERHRLAYPITSSASVGVRLGPLRGA
jgi:hypothetical protein